MANLLDPRSTVGELSRGNNVYPGGTNNATRSANRSNSMSSLTSGGRNNLLQRAGSGLSPSRNLNLSPNSPQPARRPSSPSPGGRPSISPNTPSHAPTRPGQGLGGSTGQNSADMWIGEMNPAASTQQNQAMQQIPSQVPFPVWNTPETDPLIEVARTNAQSAQEMLQNQKVEQEARINNQLDAIMQRLGLQREDALGSNESRMASQGIFRSGITGQEAGRIGEQYNQQGEQVVQDTTGMIRQLENDVASQIMNIQNQLRQAEGDFALRNEQMANQMAQSQAEALQARQDMIEGIMSQSMIQPIGAQMSFTANGGGGGGQSQPPQFIPQLSPTGEVSYQAPQFNGQLQGEYNVQGPQQPQIQPQQFNPAMSNAQYGSAATINDELRRRLYGS